MLRPTGAAGATCLSHVTPGRQTRLKGEILDDAFRRVARLPLPAVPEVDGVAGARLPNACPSSRAGRPDRLSSRGVARFVRRRVDGAAALRNERLDPFRHRQRSVDCASTGCDPIEVSENVAATDRACHLELAPGDDPGALRRARRGPVRVVGAARGLAGRLPADREARRRRPR